MDPGARLILLNEVDSTNDAARRAAALGAPPPFWVVARRQTAGRGRRGRSWASLEGNLFASGLFVLDTGPADAAALAFAAALAAAETVDAYVARGRVEVKWPNDVLIDGRKVAGVLLESQSVGGALELVVGVGVNLAAAPADTERPSTCIAEAQAWPNLGAPGPEAAAKRLAERFDHWLHRWAREGFAPVRAAWLGRAAGLGAPVLARLPDRELSGVFEDLGADGALIARTEEGRVAVRAGEIFLIGAEARG